MRITRCFDMPSRYTFTIPTVQVFLSQFNIGIGWCDPFAGNNSRAEYTNDIDPSTKAGYHLDAVKYLKKQKQKSCKGVIYDPPYSISQAVQYGSKIYGNMNYWKEVKDELMRICKPHGIAICFGWSSTGLGKSRGFDLQEVLLINHGGSKNDTIVTVEKRVRMPAKWPKVGKEFK